jgi:hypothetical protein
MSITGSPDPAGPHYAVLLGGEGATGDLEEPDADAAGEAVAETEAYGVPGLVWRPRAPEDVTVEGRLVRLAAEAMALRVGERLVPVAARDLRINRVYQAPKPGTVALVGYGGGFLAFDDSPGGADSETLATFYVPYSFVGGAPTKAHCIQLDPDTGALKIVQGDGYAIVMDPTNGITLRDATGDSYVQLKDGQVTIVGDFLVRGNAASGDPTAAQPLVNATVFTAWWATLSAAFTAMGATPLTGATAGAAMGGAGAGLVAAQTQRTKGI